MQGKVCIVTGASRGLGRHVAIKLAQRGAIVIACARAQSDLEQLANEGHGHIEPYRLDISDTDAVYRMAGDIAQRHGRIDVLINNAGWGAFKPFLENDRVEIASQLSVNLAGLIAACHAVLPSMLSQHAGHIINIGSDLARRPLAKMAVYTATKHAVAGFSHSILREFKNDGIKVSLVNPGLIDTFFAGGQEGSKGLEWSLHPDVVADLILNILTQPAYTNIDEITVHPLQQGDY